MANKIEYIFSLRDKISAKLGGITATSDKTVYVKRLLLSMLYAKIRVKP